MRFQRSLPDFAWVAAVSFAVLLLVLHRFADSPYFAPTSGDMKFYADWAERILAGQWTDHQAFYGLPGYPFLLAALFGLGFNYFAVGLLQIAAAAAVAALLYQMGTWLYPGTRGRWAGGLAAAGWTFFQPAQTYSMILMPTVWAVLAFWGVFFWSVRTESRSRWAPWLGIGLVTGLVSTLVATVLFILPIALAAAVRRLRQPAAVLAAAGCLALGVLAGTSPCWIHNRVIAGEPVWLSAHSGLNFWVGNHPGATGYPHLPPELPHASQEGMLKDSLQIAAAEAGRPLRHCEISEFWAAKARAFIRQHPGEWLWQIGLKIRNFWNTAQYDDLSVITPLREDRVTTPGLRFGLVAVFALGALPLLWKRSPGVRWVFAAVLLQMVALLPVFVTERYRLAAVPGLLLLAGGGITDIAEAFAGNLTKQIWKYAATLVAAAALVLAIGDKNLGWLDLYNSGLKALETGDLGQAVRRLELARRAKPGNAEVQCAYANCFLKAGKMAEARQAYTDALSLDQGCVVALNNLGIIELTEGNKAAAKERFEAALKLEPEDAGLKELLKRCAEEGQ